MMIMIIVIMMLNIITVVIITRGVRRIFSRGGGVLKYFAPENLKIAPAEKSLSEGGGGGGKRTLFFWGGGLEI